MTSIGISTYRSLVCFSIHRRSVLMLETFLFCLYFILVISVSLIFYLLLCIFTVYFTVWLISLNYDFISCNCNILSQFLFNKWDFIWHNCNFILRNVILYLQIVTILIIYISLYRMIVTLFLVICFFSCFLVSCLKKVCLIIVITIVNL